MDINDNSDTDTILISEEEANQRLDKILANRFQNIKSRSYFQMLIEEQHVLLNGAPVKKRIKPQVGDEVLIDFVLTPEIGLEPEPIPLDILYEDEDIIAINKPSGMVVHPAVGNWTGTFVNALLFHCGDISNDSKTLRPGIVHRLDKDTTGILIAAKTSLAQQKLIEAFSNRQVYKEYLAICIGNPGNTTISTLIGRHPTNRKLMAVVEKGGRSAITHCKVLAYKEPLSLVRILLETGRTHQIRVHLKYRGTPILGDNLYGSVSANAKFKAERQLLHAHVLRFFHPVTGIEMEIKAPIPVDMQKWVSGF